MKSYGGIGTYVRLGPSPRPPGAPWYRRPCGSLDSGKASNPDLGWNNLAGKIGLRCVKLKELTVCRARDFPTILPATALRGREMERLLM